MSLWVSYHQQTGNIWLSFKRCNSSWCPLAFSWILQIHGQKSCRPVFMESTTATKWLTSLTWQKHRNSKSRLSLRISNACNFIYKLQLVYSIGLRAKAVNFDDIFFRDDSKKFFSRSFVDDVISDESWRQRKFRPGKTPALGLWLEVETDVLKNESIPIGKCARGHSYRFSNLHISSDDVLIMGPYNVASQF